MTTYSEKSSWRSWDHKTPLYSRVLEKYFFSMGEIYEYFNDPWIVDDQIKEDFDSVCDSYPQLCNYLELYICTPVYFPELDIPEFLYDELPDQYDDIYDAIPPEHPIMQKIDALNKFISEQQYIMWYEQSNIKPVPESLADDYQPVVNIQPRRRTQYGTCTSTTIEITR